MSKFLARGPLPIAVISLAALITIGLSAALRDLDRQQPAMPPAPTEHVLHREAEKENKENREAWIESLHQTAPGVDWRAIEAENHQRLVLERQAHLERGLRTDDWTEIGSVNQAGRTHATAYSPDDGALYVGSSLGGVWKGTVAGDNWEAISDDIGYGSHGLCVTPGTPKVVTTIDNAGRIYATTNDGETWFVPTGFENDQYVKFARVLRDPGSPRAVYVLARGLIDSQYCHGLYRSDDGGLTYALVYQEPGQWPRCDMWIDRVNPGPLYLMAGATLKISHNLGETFTDVGTAAIDADNVVLTGSEAGPPAFYAALKNGGAWELWRSVDGGATWTYRYAINDFWETLCASITNENLVLFAGVECWRSTNGGGSFTKVNNWWDYYGDPENMLHADFPGMEAIWIDGQEHFFMDSDGGTYTSTDGVATVQNISLYGLGISQYYAVFTSQTDPYLIVGGSQDQGYQQSDPTRTRSPYLYFNQLISGDYGHATSTGRDHNLLYTVYPGFTLVQFFENPPQQLRQIDFPAGSDHSWMPFILADPNDPGVFYLCADHLWRHERDGGTSNFLQEQLPYDFSAVGGGYLTGLAISSVDTNRWYAVSNGGRLWYSADAGFSWMLSPSTGPHAHYFYGTGIITSPTDPLVAYACGNGYSGPPVYRTVNGGVTWEPHGTGFPSTLAFEIVFDNAADQNLFAATENGPYRYLPDIDTWIYIGGTEAPLTTYWCLESVPEIDVIRYGTYGRGIWDYEIAPVTAIGGSTPGVTPTLLRTAPNPASVRTTFAFDLAGDTHVTLEIFDVNGRRLAVPVDGVRSAGRQEIAYDLSTASGRPLENGVYIARLKTSTGVSTEKLRVVR